MTTSLGIMVRDISGAVIFFTILLFATKSFAQVDPDGFISIDCGSNAPRTDRQTNLLWVEDGKYVRTGKNGRVPHPDRVNATLDNYEALLSFRYFSEEKMRSKYCYELPLTTSNIAFILRATFLHGGAEELGFPEFDMYVKATLWKTVKYSEDDDLLDPVVQESIFFSPSSSNTTLCFVPKQGVPFISSLELRQLDPEHVLYYDSFYDRAYSVRNQLFFTNIIRWNTGAATDTTTVRYPDDLYDRLWTAPSGDSNYWASQGFQTIKSNKIFNSSALGPYMNSVPAKVMEDAWAYSDGVVGHVPLPNSEPGKSTYAILYFVPLDESTEHNPTNLTMTFDDFLFATTTIFKNPTWRSFLFTPTANFTVVDIGVPAGNGSVLNALEIYQEDTFLSISTYDGDANVVGIIKEVFNMTDWQGDPCTPEPDDWIGCEIDPTKASQWYVYTLTLSHMQNIGRLLESQYLNRLLNLYGNLWVLYHLSITSSNVNSELFQSLLRLFFDATSLFSLNMSFNEISEFPEAQWWIDVANVTGSSFSFTNLDFSNNQLSQIPRFVDIPFSNQLEVLSFSSNNIAGEFPNSTRFSNLTALQKLDLSNNHIHGEIPRSLSFENLPNIQELDISNNSFSGEFPSSFYFLASNRSFELYAGNNTFTGVLDLTAWYQTLEATSVTSELNDSSDPTKTGIKLAQMLSLVDNEISSIEPSIEEFQPVIQRLISREDFNQSGILLGGNPYCRHAKHFTQRYLCRSSLNETIYPDEKEKSYKAIILGSVFGGGFLLLCFIFSTLVIWRLSKKVYIYKMVEQELANRKVQPRYYSYHDLKVATRNFHHDTNLGKGTFGAVYKGVLSDGTTIAIKRLFTSNRKQVLNDFLNEVVLITGIQHKNLIQLKGCCIENQERILVYEYAEKGNVEDALWGNKTKLSWANRFKICGGIASGLTYLHEELQQRIIHRDIKPANVLLDKSFNAKIADFGLAKPMLEEIDVHVTQVISGTRGYFAPEYISEGILTTKVDVFSFGVLVLEIVSGRKCFDPNVPSEEIYLRSWAQKLEKSGSTLKLLDPAIQSDYSEPEVLKVINIALMCVQNDPELRPTMSEVETMLLEGQERMYDILCTARLRKEENSLSLEKMFRSLKDGMGADTISALFPGRGTQTSALGSSSTRVEEKPLLYGKHQASETFSDFSSGTREEYSRALGSMQRSLSDRVKR